VRDRYRQGQGGHRGAAAAGARGGRRRTRTWTLPATFAAITGLGAELAGAGAGLVVLEAASGYWRCWCCLLEAVGLNVRLVSPSHAGQLAGRPETGVLDCQWLARLAEMGLLRPSFVPPPAVRALRDLTRTRLHLTRDRTRERQRLEKLLEGALIRLSSAAGKMAGNQSALKILQAICDGERDAAVLAGLAHGNVKGGRDGIRARLEGMMPGEHHIELIRVHLRVITMLEREAGRIDDLIREHMDAMEEAWGVTADGVPSPGPGPDAAVLTAAQRLAEIPGATLELAIWIIAGPGLDMTRFPTAGCLVSWAGLSPVSRQSGKQSKKAKKGKGDACLKGYCSQAAAGAAGTATFLGERYRRLARRIGGARAQVAVARSILVIILAPAVRPRRPLPGPRPRLAPPQDRPRPPHPQPHPAAPGPRLRRHPHPRRRHPRRHLTPKPPLTRPSTPNATGP
jgi:transposase